MRNNGEQVLDSTISPASFEKHLPRIFSLLRQRVHLTLNTGADCTPGIIKNADAAINEIIFCLRFLNHGFIMQVRYLYPTHQQHVATLYNCIDSTLRAMRPIRVRVVANDNGGQGACACATNEGTSTINTNEGTSTINTKLCLLQLDVRWGLLEVMHRYTTLLRTSTAGVIATVALSGGFHCHSCFVRRVSLPQLMSFVMSRFRLYMVFSCIQIP